MWPRVLACLLGILAIATSSRGGDALSPEAVERFEKHVRPLLAARCWRCHGAEASKGGLRLHTAEDLAEGGDSGPAVVAGMPEKSRIIEAIRYQGELKMPPKGRLSSAEVAILTDWVRSGAPWPGAPSPKPVAAASSNADSQANEPSWALQPVRDPAPPEVARKEWPTSSIDRFILGSLERNGLSPALEADRRALIRRATFDLNGLPPTPEEVEAFLADHSAEAFARVVDRLLASPRYGERWARHWLDLARYADSNGMDENVAYANAFRYRDYVIRSFNADQPYDRFIREQLAGDLLPRTGNEAIDLDRLIATGFLVIGPKMLAEDDPVKMEMDIIDEQVDTIGKVFMGLSLGCARCHDHKFDPIPTTDYYSLAGIFKSTKSMQNHTVVAMWNERPLATGADLARIEAHQKEAAQRKSGIDALVERSKAAVIEESRSRLGDLLLAAWSCDTMRGSRRSLFAVANGGAVPDSIVREAEAFAKGNVLVDTTTYGKGIGVILNRGELPNFAEYPVNLPADGLYQIELRHAAAESRPVRLLVNGTSVAREAAAAVTGSWGPETQTWSLVAVLELKSGPNVVRLEREGPFPHIDKLALVRRKADDKARAGALKTAEELGRERKLNPRAIERWADFLAASRKDPGSPFRSWADRDSLAEPLKALIFRAPAPTTPEDLAKRYQELFDQARTAKQVDPALAEFRRVLDDPAGPFALPKDPEPLFSREATDELKSRRADLTAFEKATPPINEAMSVEDSKPVDLRVHIRGSHLTLGEAAPRRFPRAVKIAQKPVDSKRSGRLDLADWLARGDHPLTARVMVNRIWASHFGEGIVRSPDNFGRLGERPDHPELLDWLARRFVESGWSIKAMHRLIMLSSTYRMSTVANAKAAGADPENRLVWRMSRRRLEAEAIRDAILAVSGALDTTMGGTLLSTKNHAYVTNTGGRGGVDYGKSRRSIYLPVVRSDLYNVFQAFDFADPSAANGRRSPTTVAPQALFMLNDALVLRCSETFANALLARGDLDDDGKVRLAYLKAYARPPRDREIDRAKDYLRRFDGELRNQKVDGDSRPRKAWQAFCQAVFASSEFLYLD